MLVWVPARILVRALPVMVEMFNVRNKSPSNSEYEDDTPPPPEDEVGLYRYSYSTHTQIYICKQIPDSTIGMEASM